MSAATDLLHHAAPRAAAGSHLRVHQAERSFELPLGWSWNASDEEPEQLSVLPLPGGARFVYAAQLSPSASVVRVADKLRALGGRVLLRSCPAALARALGGGEALTLSSSARLDLSGYRPPHKVRNLARRGEKAVTVRPLAAADVAPVNAWLARLREGAPALKYLFREQLSEAERAFAAFVPGQATPAGVVSLTRYGGRAWHVELLCRDPEAPAGAMEHLLGTVITTLQGEGAQVLNLGEIPFDFTAPAWDLSWRNRLLVFLAPLVVWLLRGRYDIAGLHRFKNKFQPTWEARYFFGFPRLPLSDLRELSVLNGTRALMWPRRRR